MEFSNDRKTTGVMLVLNGAFNLFNKSDLVAQFIYLSRQLRKT